MTTTLQLNTEVAEFAAAVRRALADLAPDVIDDLTDGLEADLSEKLADGEILGDAGAYAQELRAAAGVAPRASRKPALDDSARAALSSIRDAARAFAKNHPWVGGIASFATSLRPVWWVLRAWTVFGVFGHTYMWRGLPTTTTLGWLILAALVIVSVQWGRGKWLPWRWSRVGVTIVSVFAVLALPFLLGSVANQLAQRDYYPEPDSSAGVLLNGGQVTNIFAYGPDGTPLTDVQLFDQNGNPLNVVSDQWEQNTSWDSTVGDDNVLVPSTAVSGASGWNIFPLKTVPSSSLSDDGTVPSWAQRAEPRAPFSSVQQLLGYTAPTAAPTPPPTSQDAAN